MIRVNRVEDRTPDMRLCLLAECAIRLTQSVEAQDLIARPGAGRVKVVKGEEGAGIEVVDVVFLFQVQFCPCLGRVWIVVWMSGGEGEEGREEEEEESWLEHCFARLWVWCYYGDELVSWCVGEKVLKGCFRVKGFGSPSSFHSAVAGFFC